MTDNTKTPSNNPQDYVPPKHRERQAEQLRAVSEDAQRAVDAALVQAGAPPAPAETAKVQDFAALGAQAILKYAEAAAMTCIQTADEVEADAQRLADECRNLADDIRHVAKVQAAAVERAMLRNKDAAQGVTALRKLFHEDITKERAEIEAAKQRANG